MLGVWVKLSEDADSIGGQLHGYKDFTFSGVTNSGRVWRKVPEVMHAWSVVSARQRADIPPVSEARRNLVRQSRPLTPVS